MEKLLKRKRKKRGKGVGEIGLAYKTMVDAVRAVIGLMISSGIKLWKQLIKYKIGV